MCRHHSVLAVVVWCACLLAPTFAEQPPPKTPPPPTASEQVVQAYKQLQAAQKSTAANPNDIKERVRHMSWLLLLGELAADPALSLTSESSDALEKGLKELDAISRDLGGKPELERELSRNAALTMRLDVARLRQAQAAQKQKLTREQELERLKQLRELATSYRELTGQIAAMNTQFLLGDYAAVRKTSVGVTENLKKLREIVAKRRDYYLFKDEPRLDAADQTELKLITEVTAPVVNDMVTHFQSLQALMAYRLAMVDPAKPEQKQLEEASQLAAEVLKVPQGASLLAYYVRGMSQRELGLMLTAADSVDAAGHQKAAPFFAEAKANLEKAQQQLAKEPATGKLMENEVKMRLAQMSSPQGYLDAAAQLTFAGSPAQGALLLKEGMQVHRVPALLLTRAEDEMRAGLDLAAVRGLLRRGMAAQLLKEDLNSVQVRARVELLDAWERMSRQGVEKVTPRERTALSDQLREARQLLARAVQLAGDQPAVQTARAYQALSLAYATILDPKLADDEGKKLFQGLPVVVTELQRQIDAAKPADQIPLREALVAARLAQGFLAVRYLPAYRDEAMTAFAAAADVQARLPFSRSAVKLFGSPLLAAMLSRPENQAIKLAVEERQLRDLMAHFVEGAVAIRLGEAEAAAKLMGNALKQVESTGPGQTPMIDAAKLLDKREADARAALMVRARTMAVLTLIAGKQYDQALLEALRPALPEIDASQLSTLTAAQMKKAVESATEPLACYGLGLALEEYAVAKFEAGNAAAREMLAQALAAQKQTEKLLQQSALLRDRYPQIVALNSKARERLTDPLSYVTAAQKLRREFRIAEATQLLNEGMRRHPDSQVLRNELIYCQIDEAELAEGGGQTQLTAALKQAQQEQQAGRFKDAKSYLTLGDLHERLGHQAEAVDAYKKALQAAPNEADRIKAESRLAVLTALSQP